MFFFILIIRGPPKSTLFPYRTCLRWKKRRKKKKKKRKKKQNNPEKKKTQTKKKHTKKLQSPYDLACRHRPFKKNELL